MKTMQFKNEGGKSWWEERDMTAEEIETLHRDSRRQYDNERDRLRGLMNAPKRHLQCEPDRSGEWGKRLASLESKIGTGFLIGLTGERGNGKTQMGVALMLRCTESLSRALFTTAVEFFVDLKSTFSDGSHQTASRILKKYGAPRLLVIDEIGKRSDTDWENSLLFELINKRYNEMLDTLLIDNRSKSDFVAAIGPSIASRMTEAGGIIECNWESFR